MVEVRSYEAPDFEAVRTLWEEAFPDDSLWNRAEAAIAAKLEVQPELFLVAFDGDEVIGTVMAGYDGHRGWMYSLAVRMSRRRTGVATCLVHEAETRLKRVGCGKLNLQVRSTNAAVVGFYSSLGYALEDRISMGRRLTS